MAEKNFVTKWVIVYEAGAFAFIIALIWLDEPVDMPALFMGAPETPVNWRESLFESTIILMVGAVIIYFTSRLLKRMKHLEGILPICSCCKRIRKEDDIWHQIESYIKEYSDAEFTHGICPKCAEKYYKEISNADASPPE
ncbi:hypothetical protein VU07_04025 [Desulfobulbus sp. F4]|nr:hypothetical protein [Desulfobulbus sp. F3]MCW5200954.1 hypothetical protein [Desulfobulbus sp. F4]